MKSLFAHSDELMKDFQHYFDKHDEHMSFVEKVHWYGINNISIY